MEENLNIIQSDLLLLQTRKPRPGKVKSGASLVTHKDNNPSFLAPGYSLLHQIRNNYVIIFSLKRFSIPNSCLHWKPSRVQTKKAMSSPPFSATTYIRYKERRLYVIYMSENWIECNCFSLINSHESLKQTLEMEVRSN